jgi:hypothetical protein
MLLARFVMGLIKGLIIGGLIGYGLAVAGMATPGALIVYPLAAAVGIFVALFAGKPIWAKGARIEVGMKAGAGAILAPGLMWLVRQFLTMNVPFDVSSLPGLDAVAGTPEIGMFVVSSLAVVAALLAGFYEADNQPQPQEEGAATPTQKKRVAAGDGGRAAEAEAAEVEAAEAEAASRKRK